MVPTASITLSTGTYVVFYIAVYAKKFMPWSVCKTLWTYVSHSCCNSKVLGFSAFKLTAITIHQSLFLRWNSIPEIIFFYSIEQKHSYWSPAGIALLVSSFCNNTGRSFTAVPAQHLIFIPNIFSNVCLFFLNVTVTCPCKRLYPQHTWSFPVKPFSNHPPTENNIRIRQLYWFVPDLVSICPAFQSTPLYLPLPYRKINF